MLVNLFFHLTSCNNDLGDIKRVNINENTPSEVIENLHLFYSDSAIVKLELFAAFSERSSDIKEKTIFKDSLRLNFFNKNGEKTTTLTALYGEFNESNQTIFVKDSVRLFNFEKQQLLETESLYWNKKDSIIFTNDHVRVTSPEGEAIGKGIKTKQDFQMYEILYPEGKINLKKN